MNLKVVLDAVRFRSSVPRSPTALLRSVSGGAGMSLPPGPEEAPGTGSVESADDLLPLGGDTSTDIVGPDLAEPVAEPDVEREPRPADPKTFIGPRGGGRRGIESVFVRLVATSGIVGICVALAAILGTQDVAFWIVGLAVSLVSVVLAAILWSSRTL